MDHEHSPASTRVQDPITGDDGVKPARSRGLLIVFEGLDGSGKTTVSNRVAAALAGLGLRVSHVRSGGRLVSDVAENIRMLARDPRNLALSPFAEFLLYVARETQQLDECIRPALECHDVVIADRFLATSEVLAIDGRGLAAERVLPVVRAAAAGLEADLHVLIDVDPLVARARRRADKVARPTSRPSSRKGLSGAGLMHRLREGYREQARRNPARWWVVDNTAASLDAVVNALSARVYDVIVGAGALTGPAPVEAPRATRATVHDLRSARAAFLGWIDGAIAREPEVAATMLGGLFGAGVDARRRRLAGIVPRLVLHGLRGLIDPVSWERRGRLAGEFPDEVARSLAGIAIQPALAWALRASLQDAAPAAVLASLDAIPGPEAMATRQRLWGSSPSAAVASLRGDDSPAAWGLRRDFIAGLASDPPDEPPPLESSRALCRSLEGLARDEAWALRQWLAAADPVSVIHSLTGLDDPASWTWRGRYTERAPRPVLSTIHGLESQAAWAIRDRLCASSPKEVLASIGGLDGERAWGLRHSLKGTWPGAVAKSLAGSAGQGTMRDLTSTPRGAALLAELLEHHADDMALLRAATATLCRRQRASAVPK